MVSLTAVNLPCRALEMYRLLAEQIGKHFNRMTSHFDHQDERFQESKENSNNNQRLAGLQHETHQPRLAAKADVKQDKNSRERKEGVTLSDERFGDISSVKRSRR